MVEGPLQNGGDATATSVHLTINARRFNQHRYLSLAVGVCVAVCVGISYSFGIISDHLKKEYHLTQGDLTTISSVGNMLGYFNLPFGYLYDRRGPRPVLLLSGIMSATGFLLLALIFYSSSSSSGSSGGDDHGSNLRLAPSVATLAVANGLINWGTSAMDCGSLLTNLYCFPLARGELIIIQKTFMGLGTTFLALVFNGFFSASLAALHPGSSSSGAQANYAGYAIFVLVFVLCVLLLASYATRMPAYMQDVIGPGAGDKTKKGPISRKVRVASPSFLKAGEGAGDHYDENQPNDGAAVGNSPTNVEDEEDPAAAAWASVSRAAASGDEDAAQHLIDHNAVVSRAVHHEPGLVDRRRLRLGVCCLWLTLTVFFGMTMMNAFVFTSTDSSSDGESERTSNNGTATTTTTTTVTQQSPAEARKAEAEAAVHLVLGICAVLLLASFFAVAAPWELPSFFDLHFVPSLTGVFFSPKGPKGGRGGGGTTTAASRLNNAYARRQRHFFTTLRRAIAGGSHGGNGSSDSRYAAAAGATADSEMSAVVRVDNGDAATISAAHHDEDQQRLMPPSPSTTSRGPQTTNERFTIILQRSQFTDTIVPAKEDAEDESDAAGASSGPGPVPLVTQTTGALTTSFWHNLLRTPLMLCLWATFFAVWGAGIVLISNVPQLYAAATVPPPTDVAFALTNRSLLSSSSTGGGSAPTDPFAQILIAPAANRSFSGCSSSSSSSTDSSSIVTYVLVRVYYSLPDATAETYSAFLVGLFGIGSALGRIITGYAHMGIQRANEAHDAPPTATQASETTNKNTSRNSATSKKKKGSGAVSRSESEHEHSLLPNGGGNGGAKEADIREDEGEDEAAANDALATADDLYAAAADDDNATVSKLVVENGRPSSTSASPSPSLALHRWNASVIALFPLCPVLMALAVGLALAAAASSGSSGTGTASLSWPSAHLAGQRYVDTYVNASSSACLDNSNKTTQNNINNTNTAAAYTAVFRTLQLTLGQSVGDALGERMRSSDEVSVIMAPPATRGPVLAPMAASLLLCGIAFGISWAVLVLLVREVFHRDVAQNYNFSFTAGILATVLLNSLMFGRWYDAAVDVQQAVPTPPPTAAAALQLVWPAAAGSSSSRRSFIGGSAGPWMTAMGGSANGKGIYTMHTSSGRSRVMEGEAALRRWRSNSSDAVDPPPSLSSNGGAPKAASTHMCSGVTCVEASLWVCIGLNVMAIGPATAVHWWWLRRKRATITVPCTVAASS